MSEFRILRFQGRSYEDLLGFPRLVYGAAGRELKKVQDGGQPADWKPMKSIGQGVNEIRLRDASGAYRVIYIAKFSEAIYVLHCFEKKTQKTSRADLDLATARYRALVRGRIHVHRG
jgi:phage-related protein